MHGEAKLLLNFLDGSDNQIQYFIEAALSVFLRFLLFPMIRNTPLKKRTAPCIGAVPGKYCFLFYIFCNLVSYVICNLFFASTILLTSKKNLFSQNNLQIFFPLPLWIDASVFFSAQ